MQPRRMAGVVVLKVSLMDRAGRLAQRMRRQIPDAGRAKNPVEDAPELGVHLLRDSGI